ncbi:MAG: universal stress protein [Cyanobacteria bacterium J06598_1]
MKSILLCSDGSAFSEAIYRYGAWFARQFQSSAQVLFVTDIRQKVVSTGNLSGSLGLGASEQLMNELVNLEYERAKLSKKRAQLILQNADQILKEEGVNDIELLNPTGFLVDCFRDFEADADMVVLGKRGEAAEFASDHLGANIERIVRSSSKPCLVTPQTFVPVERILLAYDGSPSAKRIVNFLTGNAAGFKDRDLHVITVAKSASDEVSSQMLAKVQEKLQQAGFATTTSMVAGEPEKVIAQYIKQHQITLLMMGAYGHSRIRRLIIGSTTIQLLRSSPIAVLLFR